MNIRELLTIEFVGLLSGIDSLIDAVLSQKQGTETLESYKEMLSKYIDSALWDELSSKKATNITPLAEILEVAKKYVSEQHSVDGGIISGDFSRPLDNVISRLDIFRGRKHLQPFKVAPLTASGIFPDSGKEVPWPEMIASFIKDIENAFENNNNGPSVYRAIAHVMERYLWCLPVTGQNDLADISFYDQHRLTSAVAACLYQWHTDVGTVDVASIDNDDQQRFLLVAGDFSGIQSYIFGKTNQRQSGMAKKLRARSFIVSCMLDLALEAILQRCDLPSSSVLMNSGGNFYVLAPNTPKVVAILNELSREIDKQLLDVFYGDIALHLAHVPMRGDDLVSFTGKVDEVKQVLFEKKRSPFSEFMQQEGKWTSFRVMDRPASGIGGNLCSGCGREFASIESKEIPGEFIGRRCLLEQDIGAKLTKAKAITLVRGAIGLITLAGLSIVIGEADGEVFMLSSDATPTYRPVKRLANHIPVRNVNDSAFALNFEEIAAMSEGASWLGYLKADVDWMGKVFAIGFMDNQDRDSGSIARVSALSRHLEIFFSEWMDQYTKAHYPECYTVYSGGDDVFMIGPWNCIIELALALHEQFSRFTGGNPNLTLSAAISLAHSGKPVAYVSEDVEDALNNAKNLLLPNEKEARDQLSIFDHVMKWRDVPAVLLDAKQVSKWAKDSKLSKGDLQRLHEFSLMFEKYWLEGDVRGLRYVGLLMYDIGRKARERTDQLVIQYMESLRNIAAGSPIHHLRVVCEYALLHTRRKDDERDAKQII